jgi:phosphatidylserine synthase
MIKKASILYFIGSCYPIIVFIFLLFGIYPINIIYSYMFPQVSFIAIPIIIIICGLLLLHKIEKNNDLKTWYSGLVIIAFIINIILLMRWGWLNYLNRLGNWIYPSIIESIFIICFIFLIISIIFLLSLLMRRKVRNIKLVAPLLIILLSSLFSIIFIWYDHSYHIEESD